MAPIFPEMVDTKLEELPLCQLIAFANSGCTVPLVDSRYRSWVLFGQQDVDIGLIPAIFTSAEKVCPWSMAPCLSLEQKRGKVLF